jgi:hypothetical protein
MRLNSFDRWSDVGEFTPTNGELTVLPRADAPPAEPHGAYTYLAGTLTVFYRVDDDLYLRHGNQTIALTGAVASWQTGAGRARLQVDELVLAYQPEPGPVEGDVTSFVEDEDFDFGLFIANVLNDPGRRERIYRS